MNPATHPLAALIGAALLVGGCASAPNAADMTPKPATPTTVNANQAMRQAVAAFDKRDFDDATRGKLAELNDPLVKAAIGHGGAAFIDIISPCVTFNNHAGSTRSYDWVREHNEAVSRIDFITGREEITATIHPGEVVDVEQHDGTTLRLRKLHTDYDPTDRVVAMSYMHARAAEGELLTGLLYVEGEAGDLHTALNTSARPLNSLGAADLCPGTAALDKINASLR